MSRTFVYISRWNEFVGEPGLVKAEYDTVTGQFGQVQIIDSELRLNHMVLDKKKNILYINNEVDQNPDYFKGGGGFICAYKINTENGDLTLMSKVPVCCPNPCYLSLDPTGNFLISANHSAYNAVTKTVQDEDGSWKVKVDYDDATVCLFKLNEDGSVGKLADVHKHTGLNPKFLLHAHPHCAVWNPAGTFFVTCDKGEDKIYLYKIDYENEKLELIGEPYKTAPFTSPRYSVFHPTRPFFYNNNELKTYVNVYTYTDDGTLTPIGNAAALPEDIELPPPSKGFKSFKPGEKPAQQGIIISKDGRYIYDVINGKDIDGISVFKVDQESGMPERIQYLRADGVWARGITMAPDGRTLVLTCMDREGSVLSFAVNDDGTLTPTGHKLELPGAAFAVFLTV